MLRWNNSLRRCVLIRSFDIVLSAIGLLVSAPFLLLIMVICWCETRSPIFVQKRIGYKRKSFNLVKFRTMPIATLESPTHLADITTISKLGNFLRKYKLDEIPQLWNVLNGSMSLVGPRPCLPTQHKLIDRREKFGVYDWKPGITGLAQIRGVDMSTPHLLAKVDSIMIQKWSVKCYFEILIRTLAPRSVSFLQRTIGWRPLF